MVAIRRNAANPRKSNISANGILFRDKSKSVDASLGSKLGSYPGGPGRLPPLTAMEEKRFMELHSEGKINPAWMAQRKLNARMEEEDGKFEARRLKVNELNRRSMERAAPMSMEMSIGDSVNRKIEDARRTQQRTGNPVKISFTPEEEDFLKRRRPRGLHPAR